MDNIVEYVGWKESARAVFSKMPTGSSRPLGEGYASYQNALELDS